MLPSALVFQGYGYDPKLDQRNPLNDLRRRLLNRQAAILEWDRRYASGKRKTQAQADLTKTNAFTQSFTVGSLPIRPTLEGAIPAGVMAREYGPYFVNYRPPTIAEVMSGGDPDLLREMPDNLVSAMATVDALLDRIGVAPSERPRIREQVKYRVQRMADMRAYPGGPARGLTYSVISSTIHGVLQSDEAWGPQKANEAGAKITQAYNEVGLSGQLAAERGAVGSALQRAMAAAKKEAKKEGIFPALAQDVATGGFMPGRVPVYSIAARASYIDQETKDITNAYVAKKVAEARGKKETDPYSGAQRLTGHALQAHLDYMDKLSGGLTGISDAVFGTGMTPAQWEATGSPTDILKQTYGFNPFMNVEAVGGKEGSDAFVKGAFETAYNPLNLFRGVGDVAALGVTGARIGQSPEQEMLPMQAALGESFSGGNLKEMLFRGAGEMAPLLPVGLARGVAGLGKGAASLTKSATPSWARTLPELVESSGLSRAEKNLLQFEPLSPVKSVRQGGYRSLSEEALAAGPEKPPIIETPPSTEGFVKPERERPGVAQERTITPQERAALDFAGEQKILETADEGALKEMGARMRKALDDDELRQDGLTPNRDLLQEEMLAGKWDSALAAKKLREEDPRSLAEIKEGLRKSLDDRRAAQSQGENQPDSVNLASADASVREADLETPVPQTLAEAEQQIAEIARLRRREPLEDVRAPGAPAKFDKYAAGVDPERVPGAVVSVLRAMAEGGVPTRAAQKALRRQASDIIDAYVKKGVLVDTDAARLRKAFWDSTSISKEAKEASEDLDLTGPTTFVLDSKITTETLPPDVAEVATRLNKKAGTGEALTELEIKEFTDVLRTRLKKRHGELAATEIDTSRPEGAAIVQKIDRDPVGPQVMKLPPAKRQAYYEATRLVYELKTEGDDVARAVEAEFKEAPGGMKQRADDFLAAVKKYRTALDDIEKRIDETVPGAQEAGATFRDQIAQANDLNFKMRDAYEALVRDAEAMKINAPSGVGADYLDPLVRAATEATGSPTPAPTGSYKVPFRALPLYEMGVQWRAAADTISTIDTLAGKTMEPEQFRQVIAPMIQDEIFDIVHRSAQIQSTHPHLRTLDDAVGEMRDLAERLVADGEISEATKTAVLRTIEFAREDAIKWIGGGDVLKKQNMSGWAGSKLPPRAQYEGTVAERVAAAAGISVDEAAETIGLSTMLREVLRGEMAYNPLVGKKVPLKDVPDEVLDIAKRVWGKARNVVNSRHATLNNKGKLAFAALYEPGLGLPQGFPSAQRLGKRQGVFVDDAIQTAAHGFSEALQDIVAMRDVLTVVKGAGRRAKKGASPGFEETVAGIETAINARMHDLRMMGDELESWMELIKNRSLVLDAGRPMVAVVTEGTTPHVGVIGKAGRKGYSLQHDPVLADAIHMNDVNLETARSARQGALAELRDAGMKKAKGRGNAARKRLLEIDAEIAYLEANGTDLVRQLDARAANSILNGMVTGDTVNKAVAKIVVDLGFNSEGLILSTKSGRYLNLDVLFGDAVKPSMRRVSDPGMRTVGGKTAEHSPMQAALEGFDKAMSTQQLAEEAGKYGKTVGAKLNKASVVEEPDVVGARVRGTTRGRRGAADVGTLVGAAGVTALSPLIAEQTQDFDFAEARRKVLDAMLQAGAVPVMTYGFFRGLLDDLNSTDGSRRSRAQRTAVSLLMAGAATGGLIMLGAKGRFGKTVASELAEAIGSTRLRASQTGESFAVAAQSLTTEREILEAMDRSVPLVSSEIARQKVTNTAKAMQLIQQVAHYAAESQSAKVPTSQLFEKVGGELVAARQPALSLLDSLDQFLRKFAPHDPAVRQQFTEGVFKSQAALNQIVDAATEVERRVYRKTTAPERNLLDKWLAGDGTNGPGTGAIDDAQIQQVFGARWADIQREANVMMDMIDALQRLSVESTGLFDGVDIGHIKNYWPRRAEFAGRRRIGWGRRIADAATQHRFGLVPDDYRSLAVQEADLYAQEGVKLGEQHKLGAVKPPSMRPRGEGTDVGQEVWQDAVRNFGSYIRERADYVGRNVTAAQLKAVGDAIEFMDDLSANWPGAKSMKDDLVDAGMSEQESALAQASMKYQMRSMQANILGRNAEAAFFFTRDELWGLPHKSKVKRADRLIGKLEKAMADWSGRQATEGQVSAVHEMLQMVGQDLNAGFLANFTSMLAQTGQLPFAAAKGATNPAFLREMAWELAKVLPEHLYDNLLPALGGGRRRLMSNVEKSGWISRQQTGARPSMIPVTRSRAELKAVAGTPMEMTLDPGGVGTLREERLSLKTHGGAKLQQQALHHTIARVNDALWEAYWDATYNFAVKKGVPDDTAVQLADEFIGGLFPDRSYTKGLGTKADVTQLFTKFQGDVLHLSREMNTAQALAGPIARANKIVRAPRAGLLSTGPEMAVPRGGNERVAKGLARLIALSVGAYMSNEVFKRTVGYRPQNFDPWGSLTDIWAVWSDPYTKLSAKLGQIAGRIGTNLYGGTPLGEIGVEAIGGRMNPAERKLYFGDSPVAFGQESVWKTGISGLMNLPAIGADSEKASGVARSFAIASGLPGANQMRKTLLGGLNLYGKDDVYWDRFNNYTLGRDDTFRPDFGDTALEYLLLGPHAGAGQRRMKAGSPHAGSLQQDVVEREAMVNAARGG